MVFFHIDSVSVKLGVRSFREKSLSPGPTRRRKWLLPIGICLLLFCCTLLGGWKFSSKQLGKSAQHVLQLSRAQTASRTTLQAPEQLETPPAIAYLIMASKNNVEQVQRLLLAVYHPHNEYLVHLDSEAPEEEHQAIAAFIEGELLFQECGNVEVAQPNLITYTGPTMVASTLHGMAILFKKRKDWKWFINLSASDYPLMTQDDMLYALSKVDENRNFIALWPRASWKISQRTKPVVLDAGLFHNVKQSLVYVPAFRTDPTIFKLVTGSAWVTLSRPFVEYVIMGYENLPRLALMYFANTISSPEGYLHTVLCNSDFNKTLINTDLHYITWDTPPKQHPRTLTGIDYHAMTQSGAMFARKFNLNASESLPVLNLIDAAILGRSEGGFVPGGWCHQAEKEQFAGGALGPIYRRGGERKQFLGADMSLAESSPLREPPKKVVEKGDPAGLRDGKLSGYEAATGGAEASQSEVAGRLATLKAGNVGPTEDWELVGSGTPREQGGIVEQIAERVVKPRGDAEPFRKGQVIDEEPGESLTSRPGALVESTLERVRKTWTRAADHVGGALTGGDETPVKGLASRLSSRRVLQEGDFDYVQTEVAGEKADRRGCDKFDGSFFLRPSGRVHLLNRVIATALKDSETDLCSIYHQPVTPKPRLTTGP